MTKRLFDVLLAGAGLVLLVPVLIVVGVLVFVLCRRPVLFRQVRVGRGGRDFVLNKFRTMTLAPGRADGSFEVGSLARVTPLGRFLRKTKLDELPQLWNVIKGDMSLVGPRPEVRRWVDAYPERWAKVLTVRPGITDSASVEFRDEENVLGRSDDPEAMYRDVILPRKLHLYEQYVRKRSFWGDVCTIVRTVCAICRMATPFQRDVGEDTVCQSQVLRE